MKFRPFTLYSVYLPSILIMFAVVSSMQSLSSQQIAIGANNVTMQMQHHAVHITDNLIVSEHIPLTGNLSEITFC